MSPSVCSAGSPERRRLSRWAIRDANNEALSGLQVSAGLEFPTDKHLDRRIGLIETGPGEYLADLPLRAGQWDVVIEAKREGERLFRSRNRVKLQ